MKDFGTVRPGSTIYIEFDSFGANGESLTLTGLAATDVEVYKNGGTTQRASDNGYTLLDTDGIDFDSLTGIHGLSIDLADNSTAGFWTAGAHYRVVISAVTINSQTVSFTAATFRIGYPDAAINTTIASLSSQTSFTLTSGPAEDDALNGCIVLIHDIASAVQLGYAVVQDYTGSTKTVTLTAGTTFTAASGDNISVFLPVNAQYGGAVAYSATRGLAGTALPAAAADAAGGLPISDAGGLDLDAKIGALTFTTANKVDATVPDSQKVDLNTIKTQTVTCAGGVTVPAATLASTTNITAGTITTATNLTNAPSAGDFTATMKTSIGTAVAASAVASVTGNVGGNVAGSVGSVTGAVGSVTGLTASDVAAIKVITDALGATAAARLALSAGTMVAGTVDDTGFSPTTTQFEADDITTAAADHYNGRVIIFTSGTLQYQATSISDYSLSGGRGHFTVPALTSAPANNVTFIIV